MDGLREECCNEVNEFVFCQYVKESGEECGLYAISNSGSNKRSYFTKCFNQHHRVIVQLCAFLLCCLDLAEQHLESLIIHLLRHQAINQLPLYATPWLWCHNLRQVFDIAEDVWLLQIWKWIHRLQLSLTVLHEAVRLGIGQILNESLGWDWWLERSQLLCLVVSLVERRI